MATDLGKAYIQIMPSAQGIKGEVEKILGKELPGAGESAGQSLGSGIVKAVTGVIAAAGIGKLFASSLMEGANLQQSIGGIETLFKGSADTVKQYAAEAYKTTGLSANAYMENVTGFSASLLQSLGGDTAKSADIANMAMIDMSDNANKMGTSMDSIQMAYQGFAKQNYTMLDNLKLGYGGTKSEMERLLADATKLTGVEYNIDNLSDVYNAIHAIQENLDITGTTAKEAASTFSGSFASMKAAASNVLGQLSLGEDIQPALQTLADTTRVFFFGNFLPMVGNIIQGSFGVVFGDGVANAIGEQFDRLSVVLSSFIDMLFGSLDKQDNIDILTSFGIDEATASQIVNIADNIRVTFENIGTAISDVGGIVGGFIQDLLGLSVGESDVNLLGAAFETLTGFLKDASEKIKDFTTWLKDNPAALDAVKAALAGVVAGFVAFQVVNVVQNMITGFQTALAVAKGVVVAFNAALAANPIGIIIAAVAALTAGLVWFFTQTETGQQIWATFVDWIKSAWQGIADFFVGLWSGISEGANTLWDGVMAVWNATVETVKGLWNGFVEFFSTLWTSIQTAASAAWTAITSAIMVVVQPFIDGWLNIWNGMKDGLAQMWEGVKMMFQGVWEFIKSIFMGAVLIIIDLVTGNFTQLGADLGMIWDSIKNAVSLVWEGIKTYFSGVVDAIVGYGKAMFENLSGALSAIWEAIKSAASAAWEWIKSTVSNLIDGLVQGAQNTWNAFMSFLSGLWESIKSIASSAWEGLKSSVLNIIDGLISGAQRAWDTLKRAVSDTVDRVANIFSGLANIDLWAAGKAIIDGFLNGLKSAFDGVKKFVGGIANWIRDHKGPIEYDRKLLIPAGDAIMSGLDDGLQDKFKSVKATVSGIAGEIADVMSQPDNAFDTTAMVNRQLQSTVTFPTQEMQFGTSTQVARLQLSVENLLNRLIEKDTTMYLDGDIIAQSTYDRQGRLYAREGL